jgi:hypothetical protein
MRDLPAKSEISQWGVTPFTHHTPSAPLPSCVCFRLCVMSHGAVCNASSPTNDVDGGPLGACGPQAACVNGRCFDPSRASAFVPVFAGVFVGILALFTLCCLWAWRASIKRHLQAAKRRRDKARRAQPASSASLATPTAVVVALDPQPSQKVHATGAAVVPAVPFV